MQTELLIEKKLTIKVTAVHTDLIPIYASQGAAGADLKANIEKDVIIAPSSYALISTGLKMQIPEGYEVQIRPRSGLALKHGIFVLNSPGTIDSDYRGDIAVILANFGKTEFIVTPKMRIAQMIVAPVIQALFHLSDELSSSNRGSQGFGHTGLQ
jgi:dUTP pyrophosphatase